MAVASKFMNTFREAVEMHGRVRPTYPVPQETFSQMLSPFASAESLTPKNTLDNG